MSMSTTEMDTSYDFVIIGGGTSGLTVANRISEDTGVNVLVLEAGENHLADPRVMVPALCMQAPGSELDWQLMTGPQVSFDLLLNQIKHVPTYVIGAVERSPNSPTARSPSWRLQRHQQPGLHFAFLAGNRCLGKTWQRWMDVGRHGTILSQILYTECPR